MPAVLLGVCLPGTEYDYVTIGECLRNMVLVALVTSFLMVFQSWLTRKPRLPTVTEVPTGLRRLRKFKVHWVGSRLMGNEACSLPGIPRILESGRAADQRGLDGCTLRVTDVEAFCLTEAGTDWLINVRYSTN